MTQYDIGIIGAGVYGTMIALELAQAGQSVILFDKHEFGHAQAASSAMIMMLVVFAIVVPYLYSELRRQDASR